MWQIDITVPMDKATYYLDALDPIALAGSCFETTEDPRIWVVSLVVATEPDELFLGNQLTLLANAISMPIPSYTIVVLPEKDWVKESQNYFTPLTIGQFYIHTSWHTLKNMPKELFPIEIDPSQAFGTGTHDTTQGCLIALSTLAKQEFTPQKILDMGTGTGILAMAARHLWPGAAIIAADNDPKAVEIAQANCKLASITIIQADSLVHPNITTYKPFDLVIANILAIPLIQMAPDVPTILAPKGKMVLSGFYDWQLKELLEAYSKAHLTLVKEYIRSQWGIAILEKNN